MQTHWLFILIGDSGTGKTLLQKRVVERLCGKTRDRLNTNTIFDVTHPDAPKRLTKISVGNRSFQEKVNEYKTVAKYFSKFFQDVDVAIIASHSTSCEAQIAEMIHEGKSRFYNVAGVFFSHASDEEVKRISANLNWDERIFIDASLARTEEQFALKISAAGDYLTDVIIGKYKTR